MSPDIDMGFYYIEPPYLRNMRLEGERAARIAATRVTKLPPLSAVLAKKASLYRHVEE